MGLKKLRILSDFCPHGEVAKLYGIFREKNGISERTNILVDEEGKIVFFKVYPIRNFPILMRYSSFCKGENLLYFFISELNWDDEKCQRFGLKSF